MALCRHGYYFEPSVAEYVFYEMIRETGGITVLTGHSLAEVNVQAGQVRSIYMRNEKDGSLVHLEAGVFIDATYEGDLYARAGAEYRVGREGRDEYNEPHAWGALVQVDFEQHTLRKSGSGRRKSPVTRGRISLRSSLPKLCCSPVLNSRQKMQDHQVHPGFRALVAVIPAFLKGPPAF